MKAVFLSDKGKVRQHNEDSAGVFHNLDGNILAVVADGMGGHRAGDVASSMTIQLFHDYWKQTHNMNEPKKSKKSGYILVLGLLMSVYMSTLSNM